MANTIGAPDRYIQGPREIGRLREFGSRLDHKFLVVAEEQTMAGMRGLVEQASGAGHSGHEEEEV